MVENFFQKMTLDNEDFVNGKISFVIKKEEVPESDFLILKETTDVLVYDDFIKLRFLNNESLPLVFDSDNIKDNVNSFKLKLINSFRFKKHKKTIKKNNIIFTSS